MSLMIASLFQPLAVLADMSASAAPRIARGAFTENPIVATGLVVAGSIMIGATALWSIGGVAAGIWPVVDRFRARSLGTRCLTHRGD